MNKDGRYLTSESSASSLDFDGSQRNYAEIQPNFGLFYGSLSLPNKYGIIVSNTTGAENEKEKKEGLRLCFRKDWQACVR